MALLATLPQGNYLTPRVINLSLRIVTHALTLPSTYRALQPHLQQLVQHVVFPMLCFNDEDAELWEDDPHEYIRKGYDIMEDIYSVRTAATSLVSEMCTHRSKDQMEPFMQFLFGIFTQYQQAGGSAAPVQVARLMDGALLAVGSLEDTLKAKKKYKASIEPLMTVYVLPCFQSPQGHLRAKACWVAGQFADLKFAEGRGKGATFNRMLEGVVNCLRDPELPVKVDAVIALKNLVDALADLDILKPILPQILDQFFQLMSEVENEDLVFTLEVIVEQFGDDIEPYAAGLCQNLARALEQIYSKKGDRGGDGDSDDEDDDDMSAMAAFGCLRALSTILEAVSGRAQLYPQLEEILFPVLDSLVEESDLFEEVLELVAYFTYFSPAISDRMWSLWPKLMKTLLDWGMDYLDNVLVALDNYISRGKDRFLTSTNPDYQQQVFDLCKTALTGDFSELDIKPAPKLMEVVLLNCRGQVDKWAEPYLLLALQKLEKAEASEPGHTFGRMPPSWLYPCPPSRLSPLQSPSLQDYLINVVALLLQYNPLLTLQILQRHGVLTQVLTKWFAMIFATKSKTNKPKHFRRIHDRKVSVMGLLALLQLPDEALPAEIRMGLPQLMSGILRLLGFMKDSYEQEELEQSDDEDDAASENSDVSDVESEGGYAEELDDNGVDRLARKGKLGYDEDSDDGGWYPSARFLLARPTPAPCSRDALADWTDDEEIESPLDDTDAFVMFKELLGAMQQAKVRPRASVPLGLGSSGISRCSLCCFFLQPDRVALLTGHLDEVQRKTVQEALDYAEKRRGILQKHLADKNKPKH